MVRVRGCRRFLHCSPQFSMQHFVSLQVVVGELVSSRYHKVPRSFDLICCAYCIGLPAADRAQSCWLHCRHICLWPACRRACSTRSSHEIALPPAPRPPPVHFPIVACHYIFFILGAPGRWWNIVKLGLRNSLAAVKVLHHPDENHQKKQKGRKLLA